MKKLLFIILILLSCEGSINEQDASKKKDLVIGDMTVDILSCDGVKRKVEVCLGLHEGALNYIGNCTLKTREEVSQLNDCFEVRDYMGLGQDL